VTLWLALLLAAPARCLPERAVEPRAAQGALPQLAAPAVSNPAPATGFKTSSSGVAPTLAPAEAAQAPASAELAAPRAAAAAAVEAVERKSDGDARGAGEALQAALEGRPALEEGSDVVAAPEPPSDRPGPRRPLWRRAASAVPIVTLGLAAANVAAYHAEARAVVEHYHGNLAPLLSDFGFNVRATWAAARDARLGELAWRVSTLVTSMFVHEGPNHLGHNLGNLLFFGVSLEWLTRRRWTILGVFFAAGLAGPLLRLSGLAAPALVFGASGALFGLMGALVASLLRLPEKPSDILAWIPGVLAISGFLAELAQLVRPADLGVDHLAHVAGFLVGLAFGWRLLRRRAQ